MVICALCIISFFKSKTRTKVSTWDLTAHSPFQKCWKSASPLCPPFSTLTPFVTLSTHSVSLSRPLCACACVQVLLKSCGAWAKVLAPSGRMVRLSSSAESALLLTVSVNSSCLCFTYQWLPKSFAWEVRAWLDVQFFHCQNCDVLELPMSQRTEVFISPTSFEQWAANVSVVVMSVRHRLINFVRLGLFVSCLKDCVTLGKGGLGLCLKDCIQFCQRLRMVFAVCNLKEV